MAKITVYNVQESEEHYYTELNHYDFELQLINEPLTKETAGFAQDSVGVLIDGTTQADADLLAVLKKTWALSIFLRGLPDTITSMWMLRTHVELWLHMFPRTPPLQLLN